MGIACSHYRILEIFDYEEGGQRDKDAVDEKEVECPKDIMGVEERQAVSDSAERRHEGCGDGHTADDRPLLLAR